MTLAPATDLSLKDHLVALVYSDLNCVSFDFGVPLAACLFAEPMAAAQALADLARQTWEGGLASPRVRSNHAMLAAVPSHEGPSA